jgi:type I restriction enzyme, S subunit
MNSIFSAAPAHWRAIRLKDTVSACWNGIWGGEPKRSDDDVICVRVADFDRVNLRVVLDHPTMRFVPQAQRRGRMLARGDLLLEKSGGGDLQPVGAVVLYDHDIPALCSNFIVRMRVAPGFDPRYLCYLHAALYFRRVSLRSIQQTTGIQNLDSHAYLSETVCIPGLAEQREIAVFLEAKTAQIDALLAAKQRMVELLRQKRHVLITSTVLAGLDPAATRKPAGFHWPGEMPAHWLSTRFKFIRSGRLEYGAALPPTGTDRGSPRYIRITDLNEDGTLREDTFQSLSEEAARPFLLQDGDVLLARSGATVGKTLCYRARWGPACFAGYLVRLRPDRRKILPDYLAYYTRSHVFQSEVRLSAFQATIANVSAQRYANFRVPLPPLEEQQAIARFLDRRTGKIDTLIRTIERQAEKIREYRQALIATMVTRGAKSGVETCSRSCMADR